MYISLTNEKYLCFKTIIVFNIESSIEYNGDSLKIEGCFPVVYPHLRWLLDRVKVERIMTSVSFLNNSQKRKRISEVFKFRGIIFLDCGIFQKYKNELDSRSIISYRKKLVKWYSVLQPSIASGLDVPSLLWHKIQTKRKRLLWSIENYLYIRNKLPSNIPLFLGVSAFSEKSVKIAAELIRSKAGAVENIALGGQVPLMKASFRNLDLGKIVIRTVFYLRKSFPESNIHVYGAGNPRWYLMIRALGASSADYSGYIKLAGFGRVLVKESGSRYLKSKTKVKRDNQEILLKRPKELVINKEEFSKILECRCPVCKVYSPDKLDVNRKFRLIHNLYTVNKETRIIDKICNEKNLKNLKEVINIYFKNSVMKPIADYALKLSSEFL